MTTKPTALELSVLRDVAAGKNPYAEYERRKDVWYNAARRRAVIDGVMWRLRSKGYMAFTSLCGAPSLYRITDAGRAAFGKDTP